jgi:hypothetical protein
MTDMQRTRRLAEYERAARRLAGALATLYAAGDPPTKSLIDQLYGRLQGLPGELVSAEDTEPGKLQVVS